MVQIVTSVVGCLFVLLATGGASGSEPAFITGLQVAPDQKHISLRYSGDLGRHAAFVMSNPRRLVVDFEATGVARIPGRVKVDRPPIKEVRIGQDNGRARIVIDFGDEAVPPFSIDRQSDRVLVVLGNQSPHRTTLRGQASEAARAGAPAPKPARQPRVEGRQPPSSPLSVRNATLNGDLVLVELADRDQPGKTYRLTLDFDHEAMKLRKASVTASGGVMKHFDVREASSDDRGDEVSPAAAPKPASGPKRTVDDPNRPPSHRPKFKWGAQTSAEAAPVAPSSGRGTIRVEKFKL
jgi:hypothetical protein